MSSHFLSFTTSLLRPPRYYDHIFRDRRWSYERSFAVPCTYQNGWKKLVIISERANLRILVSLHFSARVCFPEKTQDAQDVAALEVTSTLTLSFSSTSPTSLTDRAPLNDCSFAKSVLWCSSCSCSMNVCSVTGVSQMWLQTQNFHTCRLTVHIFLHNATTAIKG